jgi:uncharacterized caspase-like protein
MRLSSGAEMGAFWKVCLLLFAVCWLGCGPALAEKRVALVIGNSDYKNVPRLTNPANDATLVAAMFNKAGFDSVVTKTDLSVAEMRKALREFGSKTRDADVAVIYYAGHGIELEGNNYLIPTDATLETDTDVLDETLPLDRVLFAIEPARQLRLVILDACRDNPFAKTMKRTVASRGIGRGLAKVEPNSPNTMIAFAAKAGSTASDGDSKNSPFATALVSHLPKPGLDLRKAFGFIRDDVLKDTSYKQEPYTYGSLGGDDVPLVPAKLVAAGPQPSPQDAVRRDYELALQLATRDGWNAFLAQYPDGFYANLAKGQLNKIAAEEARATAAEKARLAEQEKARLAAEGAKQAEQVKAAAAVKAAEEARVAAEKAKQIELEKAAAAEQARAVAEKLAAEKKAAEKVAADKAAADAAAKQVPADAAANVKIEETQKVASLPPQSDTASSPIDMAKSLQIELRRVGCLDATADGEWNVTSQRSLALFNKYAGTKFDVKVVGVDVLDAVKSKPSHVCPLICEHGFKADGDRCTKITCRSGYEVGDDNTCQRIEVKKTSVKRNEAKTQADKQERAKTEAIPPKPQASGQIVCNSSGCRPVRRGCRIESTTRSSNAGEVEVCN